ncbi:hypothetical protein [Ruminiclostridium cellobioparum]|uniref:Butirosin biosynthesis protein H N-terminal domain-containing protein n=1 Tax=Ruminiclostridium cellobioparum subsp. termitidis CT1112 TaxID=1195236 RepID=S0FQJ5_RUMCE|nr:hypothetical protein [Ruminiclostridium cellobioparum]EMS71434.1 hypothetical protein CTER_2674 [Ruminiclostridium cellobioparum subsp. termitidis CT1112]
MLNKKVLKNIEPFNDIFYKGCFYSSLFPIISSFNRNIMSILTNDIIIYNYAKDGNTILLNKIFKPVKDLEEVMHGELITVKTYTNCTDIIGFISAEISNEKPIVIWVDSFYQSNRYDTYMKKHWPHTLLIYGYDNYSSTFDIIEHNHHESLSYQKVVIAYQDTVDAYKGYLENFEQNSDSSIFVFNSDTDKSGNDDFQSNDKYQSIYIKNLHSSISIISHGIEGLKAFTKDFNLIISKEEVLFANMEGLLEGVNSIINAKQAEKYKITKLFPELKEPIDTLDEILKHWNYFRTICGKFLYSSNYRKKDFDNALKRLDGIYLLEQKYLSDILKI